MELSRYTFHDAYIIEELRRTYQASDAKGRLRLLKKLYRHNNRPPFEIALLAVEDSHVEVRQWIARYGSGWGNPAPDLVTRLLSRSFRGKMMIREKSLSSLLKISRYQ